MVAEAVRERSSADRDGSVATAALGVRSPATAAKLAQLLQRHELPAGARLFAAGDPGDALYVVETGRLRAFAEEDGAEVRLGEIGRGEVVGELALVAGASRSASVFAVRDTVLLRLERSDYARLVDRDPGMAVHLTARALERHRLGRRRAWSPPSCFAFLPVGPVRADAVRALVERWGPRARLVTAEDPDVDLTDLEEQHSHVAFLLDAGLSEWSRRALRSADRVVLVADALSPAAPGEIEDRLWGVLDDAHEPDVHLLLVHPPGTELPRGTRAWLDDRPRLAGHLHLRRGDEASLARVARLLAGTGRAVVYGGGGSRGAAHLGVTEVLEDLGRPVDLVGGSSIGAVLAAAVAMGMDRRARRDTALTAFSRLTDYTLPVSSVIAGGRITRRLQAHFGDLDIADLWLPYFCVSTNLTRCRPHVHDRGPLVTALRASVSIPGVLPPVAEDGELLVDGGVIDNVPVGEMRRRNPTGHVLAVDVAPNQGPRARSDYGLAVRGLRAWAARRRGAGPPRLITTLMRSTLVASTIARERAVGEGLADLYLDLETPGGGMLDFTQADAVADQTAAQARPVLAERFDSGERGLVRVPAPAATAPPARGRGRGVLGVLLLTLRDLQLRAVRFASAIGATAVVFALLFVMTGLVEQFNREPRQTVSSLGADGWVVRDGATGAFSSSATLPERLARRVPGATPVVTARHTLVVADVVTDIVVIGYAGRNAPALVEGALVGKPGDLVLDASAGLEVGETAAIGGRSYTVVGLTEGRTLFAGMPIAYLPVRHAQDLVYGGSRVAAALLLADAGVPVPEGFTTLTPAEVADDARRPLANAISSIDLVRALLWFVAAMIIGTLAYLSAMDRRRDVAVLKAVGGGTRQLGASIALQGVVVAVGAMVLAIGFQAVLVPVFPMQVTVPGRAFWQLPLLAVVVALVAGFAGLRQAVRTDPALAFSGPGA